MPDIHEIEQSNNLYGYTMNNPLKWVDPSGLYCVPSVLRYIQRIITVINAINEVRSLQSKINLVIAKDAVELAFESAQCNLPLLPSVELLTTAEAHALGGGRREVLLTDLWTGLEFYISWEPPWLGGHTDWNPFSPDDTEIFLQLVAMAGIDVDWNSPQQPMPSDLWNPRPGVITLYDTYGNQRRIAVGYHLFPHERIMGGDPGFPFVDRNRGRGDVTHCSVQGNWLLGGHMCMYYGDMGHNEGTPGASAMAVEAERLARAQQ